MRVATLGPPLTVELGDPVMIRDAKLEGRPEDEKMIARFGVQPRVLGKIAVPGELALALHLSGPAAVLGKVLNLPVQVGATVAGNGDKQWLSLEGLAARFDRFMGRIDEAMAELCTLLAAGLKSGAFKAGDLGSVDLLGSLVDAMVLEDVRRDEPAEPSNALVVHAVLEGISVEDPDQPHPPVLLNWGYQLGA